MSAPPAVRHYELAARAINIYNYTLITYTIFAEKLMEYSSFGSILALVGMVLLLLVNLNRRSARRRKIWTRTDILLQKWGSLVAYGLIALGLLLLLRR